MDYPIPVIVLDMLKKLADGAIPKNERDNIAATLETIEGAIKKEVANYRQGRFKDYEDSRRARSKR